MKSSKNHRNHIRINRYSVCCDFHRKRKVFLFSCLLVSCCGKCKTGKQENVKSCKNSFEQISNDQILNFQKFHANLNDFLFSCFFSFASCPLEKQENRKLLKILQNHRNHISNNRNNVCSDFHLKRKFFLLYCLSVSCSDKSKQENRKTSKNMKIVGKKLHTIKL